MHHNVIRILLIQCHATRRTVLRVGVLAFGTQKAMEAGQERYNLLYPSFDSSWYARTKNFPQPAASDGPKPGPRSFARWSAASRSTQKSAQGYLHERPRRALIKWTVSRGQDSDPRRSDILTRRFRVCVLASQVSFRYNNGGSSGLWSAPDDGRLGRGMPQRPGGQSQGYPESRRQRMAQVATMGPKWCDTTDVCSGEGTSGRREGAAGGGGQGGTHSTRTTRYGGTDTNTVSFCRSA